MGNMLFIVIPQQSWFMSKQIQVSHHIIRWPQFQGEIRHGPCGLPGFEML